MSWTLPFKWLVTGRFASMLITLGIFFLIVPLVPANSTHAAITFDIVGLVVLISCLRAVTVTKRYLIFLIALTLINISIGSTAIISGDDSNAFIATVELFKILYGLLIFISIMRYIVHNSPVTSDKIHGAICAYFLLGFIWAEGFILFSQLDPSAFNVPAELLNNKQWSIYFSFTTLTTLGYGDIFPQSVGARAYAILEAAVGQIYLAVIVARLVALQILHGYGQQKNF